MKKKNILIKLTWTIIFLAAFTGLTLACTNDDNDPDACGCTFYPEINQYLPKPLSADDVIGEDTYYSGKQLRELNQKCLEYCE